MQTTYTAYLAEVRRLLLAECSSNSRFFSTGTALTGQSAWICAPTQSRAPTSTPILQATSLAPIALPSSPLSPPVPSSLLPFSPTPILARAPSPAFPSAPSPLNPSPMQPPSLKPISKASLKESAPAEARTKSLESIPSSSASPSSPASSSTGPTASRRLNLQPPIAIEPFSAGEWKTRLSQLMPSLKTHDTPPLPFGEQLWSSSEADWLILFIEPSQLSAESERFILSIKTAAKVLFSSALSPLGCLPMQQLAQQSLRPNCTCMPLKNFEEYFKEPLRKKRLWEELERLHAQAVERLPMCPSS